MKKPTDHFSLTALRKSINEHASPLFTLTKSEMEALVSRLEKAREYLIFYLAEMEGEIREYLDAVDMEDASLSAHSIRYAKGLQEWLASLEAGK